MLRVAEQYAGTDTGRQRRANEDSLLAISPLFVIADGMGGAQAGEVASRLAVESFQPGLPDSYPPELGLAELARSANTRIHELSHANAEHAGMGTTLTAVYVGEEEVAVAHVGDSRAYCLRDGELLRLTDDHSLVDELLRQGRLTPEEAIEHPQRSVITRALGIEGEVEVDTRSFRAHAGDVYLLCSDGLTTMISEELIAAVLLAHPSLHDGGEALIAAANEAGGRDNITVVLLRLEEVRIGEPAPAYQQDTAVGMPAVSVPAPARVGRRPRRPRPGPSVPGGAASAARRPRRRVRRAGVLAFVLATLILVGSAAYLAFQSIYFIGTNNRGLVTLYQGLPYRLPGNLNLYSSEYVSGVSAATLSSQRRKTLLNHSLRSEENAGDLIRSLELGQLE
jgi:serine/threonine protein phosphatase PrpC